MQEAEKQFEYSFNGKTMQMNSEQGQERTNYFSSYFKVVKFTLNTWEAVLAIIIPETMVDW